MEGGQGAVRLQHEHFVHVGEHAWTVCHDDDGDAELLQIGNRLEERFFPRGIEIGVGFIQHDESGIPERGLWWTSMSSTSSTRRRSGD